MCDTRYWPDGAVVCECAQSLPWKKKVAMQQGKYRAIVHNQPLRLRRTHFHQGQMFWLAIDCANWGCKVRVWCGGQDMATAEPRQTTSSVSLTRGVKNPQLVRLLILRS